MVKLLVILPLIFFSVVATASEKNAVEPKESLQVIDAVYIPLADHYAAIVAYELYRKEMRYADFRLTQMKNWDLLRAYFLEGRADMAFIMSPLAMDMFNKQPVFRWVGLMHRDGNALAVNDVLASSLSLDPLRENRLPTGDVASALKLNRSKYNKATYVAVPHLLSTHTVVLYSYLKQFDTTLSLQPNSSSDVVALPVAPPKSPGYIKFKGVRGFPSAFEQSLPWADVVETRGFGKLAWYSKDVIRWPKGHVECITLASDKALANKFLAVKEVVDAIRKAGLEIERARYLGGSALDKLISLIQKHIPLHTSAAIKASLNPGLKVINYNSLDLDKPGLQAIMDIAVEGGILRNPIDIEAFADKRFEDGYFSVEER